MDPSAQAHQGVVNDTPKTAAGPASASSIAKEHARSKPLGLQRASHVSYHIRLGRQVAEKRIFSVEDNRIGPHLQLERKPFINMILERV